MFLDCIIGAIMAGPAYVKRSYAFSKKCYKWVVKPNDGSLDEASDETFTDYGETVNSGEFDGITTDGAKLKVLEKLENIGKGGLDTTYKLRDWIFSRHQYLAKHMFIY
jgi:leucyl-tRNA synthetase